MAPFMIAATIAYTSFIRAYRPLTLTIYRNLMLYFVG